MNNSTNLFEEFDPVSKEQWVEKVTKDLKGKPFEDLKWQLSEDISIDPFYHPDDHVKKSTINRSSQATNDWQIGEDFIIGDLIVSNKKLLHALENGVTAPRLIINTIPTSEDFATLLKGVLPQYIQLSFQLTQTPTNYSDLFKNYHSYLNDLNIDQTKLAGAFYIHSKDKAQLSELLNTINTSFPLYKANLIAQLLDGDDSKQETQLLNLTREMDEVLQLLRADQVSKIQFSVFLGKSYFVEIAKIRALRILWANLINAYGLDHLPLDIDAYFKKEVFDDQANTNMIRSMTIAMSAAIGGVDRLTVETSDSTDSSFATRIARNIQHLLKMESYLDRVIDPAAGSFYIEKLTQVFVEKTWAAFSKQ